MTSKIDNGHSFKMVAIYSEFNLGLVMRGAFPIMTQLLQEGNSRDSSYWN